MTQYEAIFQRKSIRKFQMKPIHADVMLQLNRFIQSITPLHPDAHYRIAIIEALQEKQTSVKGRLMLEAPYYLVLTAKKHAYAALNAGFVMEQIVLYLMTKGIASCYQGEFRSGLSKDSYATMSIVAFGRPVTSLYAQKKNRKPLSRIASYKDSVSEDVKRILEAARLAPSALNMQPWRFVVYKDKIHILMKKSRIPFPQWKRNTEVGIGIALAHFVIAAEELWMSWKLSFIDTQIKQEETMDWKDCEYIGTLFLQFPDCWRR